MNKRIKKKIQRRFGFKKHPKTREDKLTNILSFVINENYGKYFFNIKNWN